MRLGLQPDMKKNDTVKSTFLWRGQPSKSGKKLMRGVATTPVRPLDAPKRTILDHPQVVKQQPGCGVFGSV